MAKIECTTGNIVVNQKAELVIEEIIQMKKHPHILLRSGGFLKLTRKVNHGVLEIFINVKQIVSVED